MADLKNVEAIDTSRPSTIFECSAYTNMQLLPITVPQMVQMPEVVKDQGFNHLFPIEIITRILQLLMPWSWGWAHVCKRWYSIIRPMTWPIIEITAESRTRRLYSAVRRVDGPLQSVIHLAFWQCHGHLRELLSLPFNRSRMLSLKFFGFDTETPEEIFNGFCHLIQLTVSGWQDRAQTLDDAQHPAIQGTVEDETESDNEEDDFSVTENQYLPLTGIVSSLLEHLSIQDLEADALCRFISWLTIGFNPLPALTSLTIALDNPADIYSLKPLLDAVASTLRDFNLDMSRELSESPELAFQQHSVSLPRLQSFRIITTELNLENIFRRRDPFTRRYPSQEYPWDHVVYTWDPKSPIPLPPPSIVETLLGRPDPSRWGTPRSGWAPSEEWGPTSDKDEANQGSDNPDGIDEPNDNHWGDAWSHTWGKSPVDPWGLLRRYPFETAESIAGFTGQTWVRINWAFDPRMNHREGRDTSHLCCMCMPEQALIVDHFPIVPHYHTLRYRVAIRRMYLVGALKEAMEE
ncbi:hypothetical protein C8J56DRAFT_1053082 [Mycena floridula]|nr:hypothetical protein C8J56DRAFT_1053082 [Mycena floridula]